MAEPGDPDYLPDLQNEKTADQLAFEMRTKRRHSSFVSKHNEIIHFLTQGKMNNPLPSSSNMNRVRFQRMASKYSLRNGTLYKVIKRKDNYEREVEVVLDFNRQESLISVTHMGFPQAGARSNAAAGHFGRDKCYNTLYTRFAIPNLRERISYFIKYCAVCQLHSSYKFHKPISNPLRSLPIVPRPFSRVGIDLIGPLRESRSTGARYIVMACCYFTKYVEAQPIANKCGATVAKFIYENLFCRYGICSSMHSDQGREFVNQIVQKLLQLTGCKQHISSSYHPQSNGQIERCNRTLQDVMRKSLHQAIENDENVDWVTILPSILFSLRSVKHCSTQYPPIEMLIGFPPKLPMEYTDSEGMQLEDPQEYLLNSDPDPTQALFKAMERTRQEIFSKAQMNIAKAQARQSAEYNKRHFLPTFKIGDKVLKRNTKDKNRFQKLTRKFTGPYTITGLDRNGLYYLKDKYSKMMKKSISAIHLVPFHEKVKFKLDENNDITEVINVNSQERPNVQMSCVTESLSLQRINSCSRTEVFDPRARLHTSSPKHASNNLEQGQLIIMANSDANMFTSDESSSLDVGQQSRIHSQLLDTSLSPIAISKEHPPKNTNMTESVFAKLNVSAIEADETKSVGLTDCSVEHTDLLDPPLSPTENRNDKESHHYDRDNYDRDNYDRDTISNAPYVLSPQESNSQSTPKEHTSSGKELSPYHTIETSDDDKKETVMGTMISSVKIDKKVTDNNIHGDSTLSVDILSTSESKSVMQFDADINAELLKLLEDYPHMAAVDIVENLFNDSDDDKESEEVIDAKLLKYFPPPKIFFRPLELPQRKLAAACFYINVKESTQSLLYTGVGKQLFNGIPPTVTYETQGDGNCLYRCFSYLLSAVEYHHFTIRNVICNYICEPKNYQHMRAYLPPNMSGLTYVTRNSVRSNFVWGSETEICAASLITGRPIFVFSKEKNWLKYDPLENEEGVQGLYLCNVSGLHFNPIIRP